MDEFDKYTLGAAGISAGGSLIGSVAGAIANKNSQKRQYKYNSLLQQQSAELQNANWFQQYDRMWSDQLSWRDDERHYNSPQAQMQRMKEAGINPTFGNGGINVGNQSMSPEMPGTSAAVGVSGTGNYSTNFGNPLNEGLQAALALRGMRVQEKKVGIQEDLSKVEIDNIFAKTQEILSQKELNDAKRGEVVENVNLIKANTSKLYADISARYQDLLLKKMQVDVQKQIAEWHNERAKEQSVIGFLNAETNKINAETAKGQLQLARDKFEKDVEFRGRELDQEAEKLYQSFEKQGLDALFKAIDEASVGIGATKFGLGFNYINEAKLSRLISVLSASHRFFQVHDFSQIDAKDPIEFKNFLEGYKKYNDLLESLKNVPSVYDSLPPFLQTQFAPATSPIP